MSARPSSRAGRDRLRREAVRVQRRVQQDAGVIAGERPAARVRAVHPRREPDDHERGVGGAERRHRPAEVARIRRAHAIEERREPGAAAAVGVVGRRRGGFWQNVGARHGAEAYHDRRTPPLRSPATPRAAETPRSSMLPAEPKLEVRSCLPPRANGNARKPPLLFVHGGYCDAWCWAPHFLPWFAAKGYAAHALSLRGHGASGGRETMFVTGLDDFAADVEHVAAGLPSPPVLIGHSMGAAVIERLLATRPVRAAALLSPVPPTGLLPMAARLAAEQPEYLLQLSQFDPARLTAPRARRAAPVLFQRRRRAGDPARGDESPVRRSRRARCSTSRCGCTGSCRSGAAFRCSCWARRTIASPTRTTSARPRATTASRRRSCPASRTC